MIDVKISNINQSTIVNYNIYKTTQGMIYFLNVDSYISNLHAISVDCYNCLGGVISIWGSQVLITNSSFTATNVLHFFIIFNIIKIE